MGKNLQLESQSSDDEVVTPEEEESMRTMTLERVINALKRKDEDAIERAKVAFEESVVCRESASMLQKLEGKLPEEESDASSRMFAMPTFDEKEAMRLEDFKREVLKLERYFLRKKLGFEEDNEGLNLRIEKRYRWKKVYVESGRC